MTVVISDCCELLPLRVVLETYENQMSGQNANTHRAVFGQDFPYFFAHVSGRKKNPALCDVTRGEIESFIDDRLSFEAPATVARRAASVITFCGWAARTYPSFANPAHRLSLPRQDQATPRGLDAKQASAIRAAASQIGKTRFERLRNRLIVELADLDGLRVNELRRLILASFSPDYAQILKVWGKGRHFRTLPCPAAVRAALLEYLPEREHLMQRFDGHYARRHESLRLQYPLFISSQLPRTKNRQPMAFAVCPKTIWRVVHAAGVAAGIEDAHPHTLRHTFAHELYARTKDIRLVAQALGHKNLNTTMRYTVKTQAELAEAMGG